MAWTTATTRSTGFKVTAAVWNSEHVDNMNFLKEVAYGTATSDLSVTATTSATAQLVVSAGAISFENVPHIIEFNCPGIQPDNAAAAREITLGIYDNGAANGVARIGRARTPAASVMIVPCSRQYRLTPSAATHTYEIRAYVSAGTGTVYGGAGGNDVNSPAYIRIWRVAA